MTTTSFTALRVAALCTILGVGAFAPTAVQAEIAPRRLALSSLGDLTPFRTIASDTLAIVDKGDIKAARARIKDLETAWDKAEATLKAKDKATWTTLDGMIDAALTDLRTPSPSPVTCAASLKALIAEMNTVDKA